MDTGESSQGQTHRGWGALSMGWCLADWHWTSIESWRGWTSSFLQQLQWTHSISKFTKEVFIVEGVWFSLNMLHTVVHKRRRTDWSTHSLSQASSNRLTHTFPQSNVVDSVDPHLPSVKRRWPGWPTPSRTLFPNLQKRYLSWRECGSL
jgi:hypothetical protein